MTTHPAAFPTTTTTSRRLCQPPSHLTRVHETTRRVPIVSRRGEKARRASSCPHPSPCDLASPMYAQPIFSPALQRLTYILQRVEYRVFSSAVSGFVSGPRRKGKARRALAPEIHNSEPGGPGNQQFILSAEKIVQPYDALQY